MNKAQYIKNKKVGNKEIKQTKKIKKNNNLE